MFIQNFLGVTRGVDQSYKNGDSFNIEKDISDACPLSLNEIKIIFLLLF